MSRRWDNEFSMLVRGFPRFIEAAKVYRSPNPEEDLCLKMGIAGFSLVCPTSDWSRDHFDFLQEQRAGAYSVEQLSDRGAGAEAYVLFACLAIGYLLGLYQAQAIDEVEFSRAEAMLANFLALHEEEVTALPT